MIRPRGLTPGLRARIEHNLREPFPSPAHLGIVVGIALLIFLMIFAWMWAVRRPVPVISQIALANAVAAPTKPAAPIVYAAIGASDVVGVGANDPASESWVNMVRDLMPADTRFVRLGRSGITLHEANKLEVPKAISAGPDIVTMWNCVNDALHGVGLPGYLDDLNQALTRLTKETKAHIVILNMPDISILMRGMPSEQLSLIKGGVQQWNKGIAKTAARFGGRVTVVDLYPASEEVLAHPEYLSADDFHPSTSGYKRLAQLVWDTIEREHLLGR